MDQASREKIVAGFVATGMESHRARLIVDIGIKAAEEAISTMVNKSELIPDTTGRIAAQSVAVQLVLQECQTRFAIMRAVAEQEGAPSRAVQLEGDQ